MPRTLKGTTVQRVPAARRKGRDRCGPRPRSCCEESCCNGPEAAIVDAHRSLRCLTLASHDGPALFFLFLVSLFLLLPSYFPSNVQHRFRICLSCSHEEVLLFTSSVEFLLFSFFFSHICLTPRRPRCQAAALPRSDLLPTSPSPTFLFIISFFFCLRVPMLYEAARFATLVLAPTPSSPGTNSKIPTVHLHHPRTHEHALTSKRRESLYHCRFFSAAPALSVPSHLVVISSTTIMRQ